MTSDCTMLQTLTIREFVKGQPVKATTRRAYENPVTHEKSEPRLGILVGGNVFAAVSSKVACTSEKDVIAIAKHPDAKVIECKHETSGQVFYILTNKSGDYYSEGVSFEL